MRLLILLFLLALVSAGTYFLGFTKGKDHGFEYAYQDTYQKFLTMGELKRLDFSESTLALDNLQLVKRLSEAIELDPEQAQAMFSGILYNVHSELLREYLEVAEIDEEIAQHYFQVYDSIHTSISLTYFDRFQDKMTQNLGTPETFVLDDNITEIADEFTATVAEGICDLLVMVGSLASVQYRLTLSVLIKDIAIAGFCSAVLNELIPILTDAFHQAGAYHDLHSLEIAFGKHLRRNIADLATVEDYIYGIELDKIQRGGSFWTTQARLKMKGSAKIKAGVSIFDNFSYEVDPNTRTLYVKVEKPKILSTEINTEVTQIKNGWRNEIRGSTIEKAENDIELEVLKIARSKNILSEAETNFEQIFEAIFMPVLSLKGIQEIEYQYKDDDFFAKD